VHASWRYERTPNFAQIPVVPEPGAKRPAVSVPLLRHLFIDRVPGQIADHESILRDLPADVLIADCAASARPPLRQPCYWNALRKTKPRSSGKRWMRWQARPT